MKKILLIIFSIFYSTCFSQETTLVLNKIDQNKFILDGIISDDEINSAKILEIIYEDTPGYNIMPSQETKGYITYSDKFLYIGIKADRERVVAPLTPRDNRAFWRADFVGLSIDTYGDARNHIILASNASGSQNDVIRLPSENLGDLNMKNANFDFQSKGRQTDSGYEVEFIIPYSEIPFPNGKNQSWKIELFTGYIDDDNEGVEVRASSSMVNRDASCQLCLLDHTIVMNNILIEKRLDFLPYVTPISLVQEINIMIGLTMKPQN
tara:strand:- start:506 stop:1303 length:798 start_codon:yes stop_codon:yes gene_type:complete